MHIFLRDGFFDRYDGKRLVNPGLLKIFSIYFPKEFPFHPHWKMTECHEAYWELSPTVDHVIPIARSGKNDMENLVTTSMRNNAAKANWTLEELGWRLHPLEDSQRWDGATGLFLQLVETDKELLTDRYLAHWYRISKEEFDAKKNR